MNDSLWFWWALLAVVWPLLNALAFILAPLERVAWRLSALAALPAVGLALAAPSDWAYGPWKIDETGRIFLGFVAALWLVAGWYAVRCLDREAHRVRFDVFFLLSMSGNFLLLLARDIPTFYAGFALMGVASAGLVVHHGDAEAVRAGRLYLVLAIIGEILLFVGFGYLAAGASGLRIDEVMTGEVSRVAVILLLIGFGIKAGALTLHFWLPLAHPSAPVPASAVLSGAMIKAGVFGWIRFLPLGLSEWEALGVVLVIAGLTGSLLGTVAGVTQSRAKAVLAYSSVSQIGIMMVGIGVAFLDAAAWPALLLALTVYAAHHGLAKGALFLAIPPVQQCRTRWQVALARMGLLLPALALAGAPFSSGAVAKLALKEPIRYLPGFSSILVGVLLPLAAMGTTLLMIRFLSLSWPQLRDEAKPADLPALGWPWASAVLMSLVGIWLLPGAIEDFGAAASLEKIWASLWPVLAGIGLAWIWRCASQRVDLEWKLGLPAGDMFVLLERWFPSRFLSRTERKAIPEVPEAPKVRLDWAAIARGCERSLRVHLWFILGGVLVVLALLGRVSP